MQTSPLNRVVMALPLFFVVTVALGFLPLAEAQQTENIQLLKQAAEAHRRIGDYDEAEAMYRRIMESGQAGEEVRVDYAWLLNEQKRYEEAWEVLASLPLPHPDEETLLLQARTARWAKRFKEAAPLYETLVDKNPRDRSLQREYGLVLRSLGRPRQALAQYRKIARKNPSDVEAWWILGSLYEQLGNESGAVKAYRQVVRLSGDARAMFKIARIKRWSGDFRDAVEWYERALSRGLPHSDRRTARLELAQSYLDKGDAEKALHQARDLLSSYPRSPDVLLLAARAATARGLPAEALHRLEQLDAVHGLDREQRRWYAGQLREAGRLQKALTEYEKLLKTARPPDRELLEAVGDLRYDTGDYEGSLSAYQRLFDFLPAAESRKSLLPKLGRAAEKAGDFQRAAEYYEGYAAGKNEDFKAQLEVARFYAGNSEHQKALPYYMKAVDLGGEEGLALEIAKTASGAGNPYLTERFAEYALRHGQEPEEAALLYAQALHSQERYAEETEFLRDHIDNYTRHAQAYAQLGYAAKEQDRLLEAKRLFGKAKSLGAEKEADLTYWQGESSRGRGDYGRATAFLRQAAEQGVSEDLPLDKSLKKLERETATRLGLGGSYYEDTNHLQVWMGKLHSKAWLHENHLPVSAQYSAGRATQKEAGFNRHAFALDLGPIMPRDNWEVEAQGGLEIYENLENIQPKDAEWTGRLRLRRFFESSSFVGVEGYRETFWLKQESPDPRYFNRIVELGDLNPGFTNDGFSLLGEKVFHPSKQALFGRGGVNFYEDGNRQYYFYSHYQIPLVDRPVKGIWAAVKPNVYLEWFDLDKSSYFSPSSHATVGGMLHTIWEAQKLRFEVELNPQVQVTEGETAFGGHALADLEWNLTERFSLGAAAFYFLSGSKENSGQFEMWRMLLNGECRF